MPHTEQAHVFGPRDLLGLMSLPVDARQAPPRAAVIVVVGGPQYRAGSHRQFVQLCRSLADAGVAALRFDATGMGDSPGPLADFTAVNADIADAVTLVREQLPGVEHIVLWGLCDGASAALLYWHGTRDPRVTGLCLLNPWVRSAVSQAQTQVKHYYAQRLRQAAFWRKLLTGKVAAGAVAELWRSVRTMRRGRGDAGAGPQAELPFQARMALAWKSFPGQVLLLLSGEDFTAKEFLQTLAQDGAWAGALARPRLVRHDFAGADHTFSGTADRLQVEQATAAWMKQWAL